MENLIKTVYEYPFTTFCVFIMISALLALILDTIETIFKRK